MEVDEEHGTLKNSVWMNYNWQDRFLTWNYTVYPMVNLHQKKLYDKDIEIEIDKVAKKAQELILWKDAHFLYESLVEPRWEILFEITMEK